MVLTPSKLNCILSECGYSSVGSSLSSIIVRQINELVRGDDNEAAIFLAHLIHESGGFKYRKEIGGGAGQPYGSEYCGRGFIQLTWDYNYLAASRALFGNDTLVHNPDSVSDDPDLSMRVSVWYWKQAVRSINGNWRQKFGMSTKAINPLEGGPGNAAAQRRYGFYLKAAGVLGVEKLASDAWE